MWPFSRRVAAGTILPDRSIATQKQNVAGELYRRPVTQPSSNQAHWPGPARFPAARVYAALMGPVLYSENGPSGHTYLFPGFIGTFHQRAARIIPVVTKPNYRGILPTHEQSTLAKPLPYRE